MFCTVMILCVAGPAFALDKAELDLRVRKLTAKFEQLEANAEKRVPAETLRKAHAIVLLDRTKGGFIFAYQGGGGVAIVKDPKSGKWGPVAFLTSSEASLGLQIGGQTTFMVIVFMNPEAARLLITPTVDFGGEARGTAGNSSGGAEGTIANKEKSVLVYDERKGLYGGAAVKGGAVSPDEKANLIYYGQAVMMQDILFDGKVKATEVAAELAKKIEEYSKK